MKSLNMKTITPSMTHIIVTICMMIPLTATAHTTYGGTVRDLGPAGGTITGATLDSPYFKSINTQTVKGNFGWAAGTLETLGDAHDIKAFRFSLAETGHVTIAVAGVSGGTGIEAFFPAFSIYSGLLHTGAKADYDTATVTKDYLATLGGTQPKRGAFNALQDWKMGNDPIYNIAGDPASGVLTPASLSTLTYFGNAADGTSANYGNAGSINGDGLSDGAVSASWWLPAGDYSLIIGGATLAGADLGSYRINTSLTVIPEVSSLLLLGLTGLGLVLRRHRLADASSRSFGASSR